MVTKLVCDALEETDPLRQFIEGFMTVSEVAAELGLSIRRVTDYINERRLKAIGLDNGNRMHWLVHRNDLDAFKVVREAEKRARQSGSKADWSWTKKPERLKPIKRGTRVGVRRAYGRLRGVPQSKVEVVMRGVEFFCKLATEEFWSKAIYIPEGGGIRGYEFVEEEVS